MNATHKAMKAYYEVKRKAYNNGKDESVFVAYITNEFRVELLHSVDLRYQTAFHQSNEIFGCEYFVIDDDSHPDIVFYEKSP